MTELESGEFHTAGQRDRSARAMVGLARQGKGDIERTNVVMHVNLY
jgi:hypothetical protein